MKNAIEMSTSPAPGTLRAEVCDHVNVAPPLDDRAQPERDAQPRLASTAHTETGAESSELPRPQSIRLPQTPTWLFSGVAIVLAAWILRSFVEALIAAAAIAVASWPLYERFARRLGPHVPTGAAALMFTSAMTLLVLAPLTFAFVALLTEARVLVSDLAVADQHGIAAPHWLRDLPLIGGRLSDSRESQLGHPGALAGQTQQADLKVLLGWAEQAGRFTAHHALIISFTILTLFFFYCKGDVIAHQLRRVLRDSFSEADRYLGVATRAMQGSVQSMVVLGLCDGVASGIAFALLGVPHAAQWAAIIGGLALVPFLGYLGVAVLACQLAMKGAGGLALVTAGLGAAVLLCGDKIVRPMVARNKVSLPFVWFLMGCLGGFEVLGPVGLVVGPVLLTIAREVWEQRTARLSSNSSRTSTAARAGTASAEFWRSR